MILPNSLSDRLRVEQRTPILCGEKPARITKFYHKSPDGEMLFGGIKRDQALSTWSS